jgi:hypothetical protein
MLPALTEGSRSITGPYLGLLGAGAFTISVVSGAPPFVSRREERWMS